MASSFFTWSAALSGNLTLGESHKYSLDRRLSGLQSQSGRWDEEKNLLFL
jgi:hypothetical protein